MTYQPSHRKPRKPRWHDRPRAWLAATWDHLRGWDDGEQPLTDDHGNHIGEDLPPVQAQPDRVWQAARLGDGTLLPVDGEPSPPGYNPAWAPFLYRQNMPRPGQDVLGAAIGSPRITGPGQLTMWDIITCRDPWPPRPEPVTWSGARVPRYVLAGA